VSIVALSSLDTARESVALLTGPRQSRIAIDKRAQPSDIATEHFRLPARARRSTLTARRCHARDDEEEHDMAQAEVSTATQPRARPSPIRIKKLGHVVIQVRDLERSLRFYTEVMNFRVSDRSPRGGVFLTAVGDHHTIALFPSDGESAPTPADGAVRLHHFAMQVGSLDELFAIRAYLKERGVPIVFEGRRALGCHTSIEFLDPDGFHLELYHDMDQIGPDGRSRPRDPSARYESLEASRDNPKPPTW
jgi:catechol 2,3-dioxygenase-like lactoylglutathione lyase family enzyme